MSLLITPKQEVCSPALLAGYSIPVRLASAGRACPNESFRRALNYGIFVFKYRLPADDLKYFSLFYSFPVCIKLLKINKLKGNIRSYGVSLAGIMFFEPLLKIFTMPLIKKVMLNTFNNESIKHFRMLVDPTSLSSNWLVSDLNSIFCHRLDR
jgi:hypothetical protein